MNINTEKDADMDMEFGEKNNLDIGMLQYWAKRPLCI
jgi:hypothetical protein